MSLNQALLAAQTAFHFGDQDTFAVAVHLAQAAAKADTETVRQLSTAIGKFPANEALEIVSTVQRQHQHQAG